MRILCYGAGAVGCAVGGSLSAAGHDVTLIARPGAADALRRHGITLESPNGRLVRARPRVVTTPPQPRPDQAPYDLVLLALKAYDVPAILPDLADICGPDTSILSLQNGVGTEEALMQELGADRIVPGSFTLSVSVSAPGRVLQHTRSGGIAFAEVVPLRGRAAHLAAAFGAAGLRVRPCPDWRAMKWSKLLLNLLANATCAITGLSPAEVFAHPALFRLEQQAFAEARRVMRRLGLRPVGLPGYPVRLLCWAMGLPAPLARRAIGRRAGGGRGDKLPSLALDLARGKAQSEVTFLNGAVARVASECGVRAPVNACLTETLLAMASGRLGRAQFDRRPEALLALLQAGQ